MKEGKKTKKAIIREELVVLTGDYRLAIVLNQFIYWSERVKDADRFIKEEIQRAQTGAFGSEEREKAEQLEETSTYLLKRGWIYKTAEQMSQETMMGTAKSTMLRYMDKLVKGGWLDKRKNPNWSGDNAFQYRVNLVKIQKDLFELGYALEGYKLPEPNTPPPSPSPGDDDEEEENSGFRLKSPSSKLKHRSFRLKQSQFQNETGSFEMKQGQFQNEKTLPEIITETNSEIKQQQKENPVVVNFKNSDNQKNNPKKESPKIKGQAHKEKIKLLKKHKVVIDKEIEEKVKNIDLEKIKGYINYFKEKPNIGNLPGVIAAAIRNGYTVENFKPEPKAYTSDIFKEKNIDIDYEESQTVMYEEFGKLYELLGHEEKKNSSLKKLEKLHNTSLS